ncbi:hypothetical protein H4217_006786, partial [Coemansia sp. RSA 1939]
KPQQTRSLPYDPTSRRQNDRSLAPAHESSVSVSPAPSSSATTSMSKGSQSSMLPVASAAASVSVEVIQNGCQDKDVSAGQNSQHASVVSDKDAAQDAGDPTPASVAADRPLTPEQAENDDGGQTQDETGNKEGASSHQKRRLNQACLLCRRKKIRCDSVHPSCSNCQRRGIQCIYPEVRKRGRPPRMYTFADFVQPGQPLPPELQSIANVHASAMLSTPDQSGDGRRHGAGSGASAAALPKWRSGVPASAGSGAHGIQSAEGDISGTSTPAYAYSDYAQSSGLPPLNVAFGRSSGPASFGYHYSSSRGMPDPMIQPPPPLVVDQAVLDLFEYVIPNFPIIHRQTVVQQIRDRTMPLPLWLAIHAVSARYEAKRSLKASHSHGHYHQTSAPLHSGGNSRNGGGSRPGTGYAEKTHAILVNRFGQRQPRPSSVRGDRSRTASSRDLAHDFDEIDRNLTRRETIDLLQSLILLSIYYAGNWELELAVETHAAAVRIAQRMGVHLLDDPTQLPETNGIFNMGAAPNQRKRAKSPGFLLAEGSTESSARWRVPAPPPLPGGPNDMDIDIANEAPAAETAVGGEGSSGGNMSAFLASADMRREWIEFETLRRLWWSMFILDRMYYTCAGVPRIVPISSFRVRLPCSDIEWDSMHALPAILSPTAAAPATADTGGQSSGLMVRTFREAVMHTSLTEQSSNEIAATPSRDPEVYRYFAALAGLVDSVADFGDDIRALASPSMVEGTEILAQLRNEKRSAEQLDEMGGHGTGYVRSAYGRIGTSIHESALGNADGRMAQPSTATWLGSQKSRKQFARTSHAGWISGSTSSAWPPDWRSRMRVLQERVAALEAQFTEWYSSMPIAQYARKPYLYSQLPLQDRITYFHQQIVYYSSVIQLQSLVLMAQGLLLPDTVDDSAAAPGSVVSVSSPEYDPFFGPSALTDMLWRSLIEMETDCRPNTGTNHQRHPSDVVGDPAYASRRRQFSSLPSWTSSRRPYRVGGDGLQGDEKSAGDDALRSVPLDEGGNSPEIVREELQRMVQAAWRRCTEAAIAMSTAVKRATEVRRVASANPKMPYYDPTFRPQVLPPYRGDVVSSDRSENHSPFASAASSSRHGWMPAAGETNPPSQQSLSSGSLPAHGYSDGPRLPPIDRRGSGGSSGHLPYQQQQHHHHQQQQPPPPPLVSHGDSPSAPSSARFVDSAAGPGQVLDDATVFMRFNMFTCSAVYIGAFIHMQNIKLIPRWEEAARGQDKTAAKAGEMRRGVGDVGMVSGVDERDLGILPPPLPPRLPSPPCALDKARDGVKPLVKILEGMAPYWRVSGHIAKLRSMWRDVEGTDLPTDPLSSPPIRAPVHAYPPSAPVSSAMPSGQAPAPPHPMPMSATDHGQWTHSQHPPAMHHQRQHQHPPYSGHPQSQQLQPPPPPSSHHHQSHHSVSFPRHPPSSAQLMPHTAHNQRPLSSVGSQTTPQQQHQHQHQQMGVFPPRP